MSAFKRSYRLSYSLLLIGAGLVSIAITPRVQALELGRLLEKKLLTDRLDFDAGFPSVLHEEAPRWTVQPADSQKVSFEISDPDDAVQPQQENDDRAGRHYCR